MSTQKKGISSELIAQKYFNKDPNNMVFVPLLGLGAIDIVVINKKTKKITLYDVKTISRRTKSYAKSDEKMIIYRPLKAIAFPCPISPNTFSTGTSQFSKYKVTVDEPFIPIFFSSDPIIKPGKFFSTIKDVYSLRPVLAKVTTTSDQAPLVM